MPVSQCMLQCKTKHMVEACGCHATYMEPVVENTSKFRLDLFHGYF